MSGYRTKDFHGRDIIVRGHHESDQEVADRRANMPSDPSVPKVTVSIPVTVGSYTGQRGQWEQQAHDYVVAINGSNIVLKATDDSREITLDRHGLEAAIAVLGTL